MKHFRFWALLIGPVLILSACKKSTVHPATITYSMSFKINGTLVKTDSQDAFLNDPDTVLNIDGHYNDTCHIDLSVVHPGVGTFTGGTNNQVQFLIVNSKTSYGSNTGTVTITSYSLQSVSGTFQFSCYSPDNKLINITDGQFTTIVYY